MPTIKVSVTGESVSSTRMIVKGKKTEYIVDKEDSSPLEYILAALAGCINIVGFMVAREMNLNIEKIVVEIEGRINTDKLMGKNVEERAGYKEIKVKVKVQGNVEDEKLKEWIAKVEERCPVGDNIMNETPVCVEVEKA
ncbi:OsmC family peroxiredoxin [Thermococcus sp. M39]|uniref:OsmC family protein n=1 Tax=unclassified Thermococcus TaxID=2627626 RepID=UPI001438D57B|nr:MULTISPECIES: OsmC family protein [unclassified Thermococcus]NJE08589.1 OsmC family peroxiredoxin [Thermococcus sp. M39]NJE13196.1 OsmC family peroxiredoxin [Thermococcus sp. LS2]